MEDILGLARSGILLLALGLSGLMASTIGTQADIVGGRPAEGRAVMVAEKVFPPPCDVRIRWKRLKNAAAQAVMPDCVITFASNRKWTYPWFCTAMIHEYGHISGREHSKNPRSVMYAYLWKVDKRCRKR